MLKCTGNNKSKQTNKRTPSSRYSLTYRQPPLTPHTKYAVTGALCSSLWHLNVSISIHDQKRIRQLRTEAENSRCMASTAVPASCVIIRPPLHRHALRKHPPAHLQYTIPGSGNINIFGIHMNTKASLIPKDILVSRTAHGTAHSPRASSRSCNKIPTIPLTPNDGHGRKSTPHNNDQPVE